MDGSVEHLGQLDFLHARESVILLGPPGTGKTHLAVTSFPSRNVPENATAAAQTSRTCIAPFLVAY
ncbi:ATP-binding protein [Streptomyces endocoffeicus]|uniref:ATP-binding protein n=1 Tax=Streptomyces endocoffeicus TaxID=2898945 RepID=UPI003556F413